MPYTKHTKRLIKKGYYKGRPRTMATKAYVQKAIKAAEESKFLDTAIDLVSTTHTHTPVNISLIAGGTTAITRIGDLIHLTSIQMKLQSQPHLSTPLDAHVKVMIFRWFDTTAPVAASINLRSATVTAPVGLNNITTSSKKYHILYTEYFNIVVGASNDHVIINKFMKLKGKAEWSSGSATAITTGQLFLQIVSDLNANGPDTHITTRLRYRE